MCNTIHPESIRTKGYGIAYKLFENICTEENNLYPPFHVYKIPISKDKKENGICGWINWKKENNDIWYDDPEVGFCVIKDINEAREFYKTMIYDFPYSRFSLYKIQYAEGIVEHKETMIFSYDFYPTIILVKSFRLIKRISYNDI
jgi:hypothetical protein